MSDVLNLSGVNLDILLEIVQHELSVHDLLNLRLTCKNLLNFINTKSPWIVHLQCFSSHRPLPLPPFRKLSQFSVFELVSVAFKADQLMLNWKSQLPMSRPSYKMVSFAPSDVIVSILLIPHTPYVLTLSVNVGRRANSWITCVDTERGKKIEPYRTEGLVSSWRAEYVAEGVVVVAMLIGPEDRSKISPEIPAQYNVLRLTLPNPMTFTPASFHTISSHFITSAIMGMFLTSEVAGLVSVIKPTQTTGLLMTRFSDGATAHINSGVPISKPNLNTIANQSDLILYTENNHGASAYIYSFEEDLHPLFSPSPENAPQRLVYLPPASIRHFKFHPTELCDGSNNAYSIIRHRWKGLTASKDAFEKTSHSEISVLSMAYVLGVDPNGMHDHRCISHMYLDLLNSTDDDESVSSSEQSDSSTVGSASSRTTPDIQMRPKTPPSSALAIGSPAPTVVSGSDDGDEEDRCGRCLARRNFHSCLEEKREIWQGPSRNDLISVGLGASHAIWLAAGERIPGERRLPELRLASFEDPPFSLPIRPLPTKKGSEGRIVAVMEDGTKVRRASAEASPFVGPFPPKTMRTLKLPQSIDTREISALSLDDANGIIALATTRSELWLLDYAFLPQV